MPGKPYFDARKLPEPTLEYVAWLDVMGIQSNMARSLSITANFVFKLHIAALEAPRGDVHLYPVMDGLYIASPTRAGLENFLRDVFASISWVFMDEENPLFRFIIKGAVAFGPVVHGLHLSDCSPSLKEHGQYRDSLLLGLPMVQAHQGESEAPPFGMFVHESARAFSPKSDPFHNVWWHWLRDETKRAKLAAKLKEHYAWCRTNSRQLLYSPERIDIHEKMAEEFLTGERFGI